MKFPLRTNETALAFRQKPTSQGTKPSLLDRQRIRSLYTSVQKLFHRKGPKESCFAPRFVQLPREIIELVEQCLPASDWKNLLAASKMFYEMRKETAYIALNRWTTLKFYYQLDFQQNVLSRILQPALQLSLIFDQNCNITEDYFQCFVTSGLKIHCLKLKDCHELERIFVFDCVRHLVIENCERYSDVSTLVGVPRLEIVNCRSVRDVSPLKYIPHLTLINLAPNANLCSVGSGEHDFLKISGDEVTLPSVRMFKGIRSLSFAHCKGFRNVTSLQHLYRLDLSYCRQLVDVSALGRVYDLNLSYCVELENVKGLGVSNRILNLTGCVKITDVSGLGSCYDLNLSYCSGITDITALHSVHRLSLVACCNVTDVSKLGRVYDLDLSENIQLRDISALGRGNYRVNLTKCIGVESFDSLCTARVVNLSFCNPNIIFDSLPKLHRVQRVILSESYHRWLACSQRCRTAHQKSSLSNLRLFKKNQIQILPEDRVHVRCKAENELDVSVTLRMDY